MVEDEDKKEEEKFDFTAEGEALGYISLDQARVLAIQHARDNTDFYGPSYSQVSLVWEVISQEDSEDYYDIQLSFRPSAGFRGEPGIEQITIEKSGTIELRQILRQPARQGSPFRLLTGVGLAVVAVGAIGTVLLTGVVGTGDLLGSSKAAAPVPTAIIPPTPTATPEAAKAESSGLTTEDIQAIISKALAESREGGQGQSGPVNTQDIVANVLEQIQAADGPELTTADVEELVVQASEVEPPLAPLATIAPTRFPTATPFLLPTPTEIPTPTITALSTPTPAPTPIPTNTSIPSPTPIPIMAVTPEPTPTATPVPKPTPGGHSPRVSASESGVFVADVYNDKVLYFSHAGLLLSEWGTEGPGLGEFQELGGLEFHEGKVYVTDRSNNTVQVFNQGGYFFGGWGTEGGGEGQFKEPSDIEIYGNRIYVLDTGNHRIQVFRLSGGFLYEWGSEGRGKGEFDSPTDMAIFDERVYVLDAGNGRIQIYNLAGNRLIGGWDITRFEGLGAIAVRTNRVFVVDTNNHRVLVFSLEGMLIEEWGLSQGSGEGQFNRPAGIEPYSDRVYLFDTGNARIQVFSVGGTLLRGWSTRR